MVLKDILGKKTLILDGAMGTMIQRLAPDVDCPPEMMAIEHPELITNIHSLYVQAGADIIYTNTFGVNALKLQGKDVTVQQAVEASVAAARKAAGDKALVALDIGPLGQLLEPTGTLPFADAVNIFAEVVKAGTAAGVDLIIIETMTDLYEVKAAVLAAKENSDLPIFTTMSFEKNGRTFAGCTPESFAITMEGLGVDAIGINCSLGPDDIRPIAEKLAAATKLPVIVKPNAGLPHPRTGEYTIDAGLFAAEMEKYLPLGIAAMGGCCGSDPSFIEKLSSFAKGKEVAKRTCVSRARICTPTRPLTVDRVRVIGERINPTGKKMLQQALRDGDMDYILRQAVSQVEAGAEILDVNTGLPGIDETEMLPRVVKAVQSVVDVPLQIDSSNPEAIEAALRIVNGKAIVNSVNGEDSVLDAVLPLVKKYGASVVGLTLDENGIPDSAEKRIVIAEKILDRALSYGIPREDVYIDCLTLTVSAQQEGARQTLEAMDHVHNVMGLQTVLGVSNISFGLPARGIVNRTFLAIALAKGLTLPIINPNLAVMMETVDAFRVLYGEDEGAKAYVEQYADAAPVSAAPAAKQEHDVFYTIAKGMEGETAAACRALLQDKDPMSVVNEYLIPALDKVGEDFEKGRIFLPQLIRSAAAAQKGFDEVKTAVAANGAETVDRGTVIMATVKGDIHDIGKNIVKVIMENYGYKVIDLGRDVAPETVVEQTAAHNVGLVGLSSLMTTTLPAMEETIRRLRAQCPAVQIMVGGAVLTESYAKEIGADYYAKDAKAAVDIAKTVFGK